MIRILTAFALAPALSLLPILANAQESQQAEDLPQFTLEQRMLLRCSAGFAIAAMLQEQDAAIVAQYPPLAERGREFFVRASARVMDEAELDRTQIEDALTDEANEIVAQGSLPQVMAACLPLLPPE